MLIRKIFPVFLVLVFLTSCGITIDIPMHEPELETANESEELSPEELAKQDQEYKERFVDKEVPDFKMNNLTKDLISLSDLIGTPYVLYFARTDCDSCDEIYPEIEKLKNSGYLVVSVYRRNSATEILEKIPEALNDKYILSGLEDEKNNNVLELFDLQSVPTLFFVNSKGVVKDIVIGSNSDDDLLKIAKKALD